MRFWDWPAAANLGAVEATIARQMGEAGVGTSIYWAVENADGVIGCCDLSEIDRTHARAEVGYLFRRSVWGRGYAREAMAAIVTHAFSDLGLERLWARIHLGNTRSQALLEALGFAYEGRLRGHVVRDGARRDCLLFGRLRD